MRNDIRGEGRMSTGRERGIERGRKKVGEAEGERGTREWENGEKERGKEREGWGESERVR